MKTSFFTTLGLAAVIGLAPICAASEEPASDEIGNKISQDEWQKIIKRVRSYDENAAKELMDIVVNKRCPGTAEELVAMLKIAAGMGEKRAQELLAACYQQGVGVRDNANSASTWRYIYNNL